MNRLLLLVTILLPPLGSAFAAGLPTPQDVLDQLKKLYPDDVVGAEIFPKGDKFEVLFLSPRPTSCLVHVATHRVSNCHYDDVEPEKVPRKRR